MTELKQVPTGWRMIPVGNICNLGRGRVISQLEIDKNPGEYPVYSSQSKDEGVFGYLNTFDFDGEYVTWTTDGAYAGTVFYRSGRFNCTNVCGTLKAKSHDLSMAYLAYALSVRMYKHVSYIGNPKLMNNVVAKIPVPLPPLPEQRRIAEILNTADESIRQTERLIAKLKAVKTGLLHDLLTRGLDEDGHLRDPQAHPGQFKVSALGRIPEEWQVVSLVESFSFPGGQVDPKQEPYRDWPLIAPDHIESGTGRLLNVQTAAEQSAISGKYAFEPGDVLYSKIRPYLRKAVLADRVGLCSADMYPLRPGSTLVPRFLLALILSEDFSRFASSVSMRSGFPKINREEFGEYTTSLPDYDEQQRIVAVLDAHDARIQAEEAALDKLRQVKRGLMDDLLTGKVRVISNEGSVV